jgi:hypothetical protein
MADETTGKGQGGRLPSRYIGKFTHSAPKWTVCSIAF